MIDESLINIVEFWDEFDLIDRKLIWWKCFKHKYLIESKLFINIIAALSAFVVVILEPHQRDKVGLLAAIVLLYFYTILIDYIYKRVYR